MQWVAARSAFLSHGCTLAEAFALLANVVAQHGSEHEVFCRGEFVQGFMDEGANHVKADFIAKVKIDFLLAYGLLEEGYALVLKPFAKQGGAFRTHGAEHQLAHALAILVNLVHEELHGIVGVEIFG